MNSFKRLRCRDDLDLIAVEEDTKLILRDAVVLDQRENGFHARNFVAAYVDDILISERQHGTRRKLQRIATEFLMKRRASKIADAFCTPDYWPDYNAPFKTARRNGKPARFGCEFHQLCMVCLRADQEYADKCAASLHQLQYCGFIQHDGIVDVKLPCIQRF